MANPPRIWKRVHGIRRAPDGSAFQNCLNCGVSVAIALADMHVCESKKDVKRFKSECGSQNISVKQSFEEQPRSPFRLFMESFMRICKTGNRIDFDRKGFEIWKNLSREKRHIYVLQAEKVNSVYMEALFNEANAMTQVDDEADSAMVGKFDQSYDDYESSEYSDSFDSFRSRRIENFNTYEWKLLDSRFLKNDEVIGSGESLTFDSHLVDIGEPEGNHKPLMDLNVQGRNSNLAGQTAILHGQQNRLKENKAVVRKWHALYTTQITQKAKKYHSGFIRLSSCGSHQMQGVPEQKLRAHLGSFALQPMYTLSGAGGLQYIWMDILLIT